MAQSQFPHICTSVYYVNDANSLAVNRKAVSSRKTKTSELQKKDLNIAVTFSIIDKAQ